ncbi:MAG: cyclic-phosphate processing receiver domain-containing protein [Solirubrobacteraceae bacterium]
MTVEGGPDRMPGEYRRGREPLISARVAAALDAGGELRVWLDDDFEDRAAPQGWVHVDTVAEVIALLDCGRVVELSLDHDLGDDEGRGRGPEILDWLAEQQEMHDRVLWPRDGIALHTANPQGRDAMARTIRRYASRTCHVRESRAGGQPRFEFDPPSEGAAGQR